MPTATETKERPLIFTAESVRAMLAGTKTMTRRIVKPQPKNSRVGMVNAAYCGRPDVWLVDGAVSEYTCHGETAPEWRCPFKVGAKVWVKETWGPRIENGKPDPRQQYVKYKADGFDAKPHSDMDWHSWEDRWRSPLFMPRWASRLTLEITGVRVERVTEISGADAIAEGIEERQEPLMGDRAFYLYDERCHWTRDPRESYRTLWERVNGRGSWASNPWVWCISFNVLANK